jgi:hypothetical protein
VIVWLKVLPLRFETHIIVNVMSLQLKELGLLQSFDQLQLDLTKPPLYPLGQMIPGIQN